MLTAMDMWALHDKDAQGCRAHLSCPIPNMRLADRNKVGGFLFDEILSNLINTYYDLLRPVGPRSFLSFYWLVEKVKLTY